MLKKFSHCSQFEPLLDAFLDDELSKDEHQQVKEHLTACQNCQAHIGKTTMLVAQVGQLSRIPLPRPLEFDWDALIDQQSQLKGQNRLINLPLARLWTAAALAASVIILLLVPRLLVHQGYTTVANAQHADTVLTEHLIETQSMNSTLEQRPFDRLDGTKENPSNAYGDLLAVYPADSSSFSEEVGISTDEDGLYALKL